ncbi:hypothetical protein GGF42_001521, partial [Coemansia sp. RSA 2424]
RHAARAKHRAPARVAHHGLGLVQLAAPAGAPERLWPQQRHGLSRVVVSPGRRAGLLARPAARHSRHAACWL